MFARSKTAARTAQRIATVGRHVLGSPAESAALHTAAPAMASTEAPTQQQQQQQRVPLLSLPLVAASERLTANLLPDAFTPRPDSVLATPEALPTQVRRARPVGSGAHFSYVSPLVLEFPYDFPDPSPSPEAEGAKHAEEDAALAEEERRKKASQRAAERRMHAIEGFMRRYEVDPQTLPSASRSSKSAESSGAGELRGFLAPARADEGFPSARLLGVSPAALRECLPALDVGDALEKIAADSGKDYGAETYTSGPAAAAAAPQGDGAPSAAAHARTQLSDVLAGRLVAARFPPPDQLGDDAGAAVEIYRRETAKEKAAEQAKQRAPAAASAEGAASAADSDGDRATANGSTSASASASASSAVPPEQTEEEKLRIRLSNLAARARDEGKFAGYAPWANCYAGHQFGSWAGQLGDGRAITLAEVASPADGGASARAYGGGGVLRMPPRTEIQLKGAGRTPYSRFADGLATLASSLREYLCSEAMGGLRVPTSRALAVLALKQVTVLREAPTVAAVTARLAPSWLRIGSFQIHSSRGEWESVRILGEYVARAVLGLDVAKVHADLAQDEKTQRRPWALDLAKDVARRNAETIARWQVYGFMHGVMNTDNISLLGLTIDYGPYAFMDIYEEHKICNHSDGEGRYTYARQPAMGAYAVNHLTMSLSPIIGFEQAHGRAPLPFELLRAESDQLEKWSEEGAKAAPEVETVYNDTFLRAWNEGWLRRLGLRQRAEAENPGIDKDPLVTSLLSFLEDIDFSSTLRSLCAVPALGTDEAALREFAASGQLFDKERLPEWQRSSKEEQAVEWLRQYAQRLAAEGPRAPDEVAREMRAHNPRFILRNWVTDYVVQRVTLADDTRLLAQVLEMCAEPFKAWGEDVAPEGMSMAEAKRLCGLGVALSFDNLPSCSS